MRKKVLEMASSSGEEEQRLIAASVQMCRANLMLTLGEFPVALELTASARRFGACGSFIEETESVRSTLLTDFAVEGASVGRNVGSLSRRVRLDGLAVDIARPPGGAIVTAFPWANPWPACCCPSSARPGR
jgi:hypothetical protein